MKKVILGVFLALSAGKASACTTCNKELQEAIFSEAFVPDLFTVFLPFIVLAIVVALLSYLSLKKSKREEESAIKALTTTPLVAASATIGMGIGGFIDGIFLHQILQWHELLSNKIPPVTLLAKSVNMFWDGIFHLFSLIITLIGIFLLWKLFFRNDVRLSTRTLVGGMIGGWGVFNVLEGIADHLLLKLHNVREISDNVEAWNYGFLGFSFVLLLLSYYLIRTSNQKVQQHF